MDRFIAAPMKALKADLINLKSNMDRFIEISSSNIVVVILI